MGELLLLTDSRLRSASRCLRLHHYEYDLGLRPAVESDAVHFGKLWHAAQEAWWLTRVEGGDALGAALSIIAGASSPNNNLDSEAQIACAEAMMIGYDIKWKNDGLETIAAEVEFTAPLRNPETGAASRTWQQGGKLDGIVREVRSGRVLILEHKSTSLDIGPDSTYWRKLLMDSQITMYYRGAEALGYRVEGCVYDVIKKPGLRLLRATPEEKREYTKPKFKQCPECKKKNPSPLPHNIALEDEGERRIVSCEPADEDGKSRRVCTDLGGRLYANLKDKDETIAEFAERLRADICADPDRYYQRAYVVRLEAELDEHRFSVWQTAQMLRESMRMKRYPMNPNGCERYGSLCGFFDVCTKQASIDDRTRWIETGSHPELGGIE